MVYLRLVSYLYWILIPAQIFSLHWISYIHWAHHLYIQGLILMLVSYLYWVFLGQTHVDDVLRVSLLYVVENSSLMEITQGSHVLHSLHTGVVHHHDVVVGEVWTGKGGHLGRGERTEIPEDRTCTSYHTPPLPITSCPFSVLILPKSSTPTQNKSVSYIPPAAVMCLKPCSLPPRPQWEIEMQLFNSVFMAGRNARGMLGHETWSQAYLATFRGKGDTAGSSGCNRRRVPLCPLE